jgi:hypothetical protein
MLPDEQRSQVEQAKEAKAMLLVPSPSDTLPFERYVSWVFWSSALWLLGVAPFIPIAPLGFLRYAPLVFGFWLGFRKRGKPWGTYVLSGIAVGLLALVGVYVAAQLLLRVPDDFFSTVVLSSDFAEYFIELVAMFWVGTLLGNFIKQRALGAQATASWQVEQEREERRREREQAKSTLEAERDRLREDQRRAHERIDELRQEVDRLRADLEIERSKGSWRRRLLGR